MPAAQLLKNGWRKGAAANLGVNSFYRWHIVLGILVPLVVGAVLFASSPSRIKFIDALFLSCSSLTTTGLNTVLLSPLTTWQQVLLLLTWLFGNPIFISWLMLVVRRYSFASALQKVDQSRGSNESDHDSEVTAHSQSNEMDELPQDTGALAARQSTTSRSLSRTATAHQSADRGSWTNPAAVLFKFSHSRLRKRIVGKEAEEEKQLSFDINKVVGPSSEFLGVSVEEHERLSRQEMGAMDVLIVVIIVFWAFARTLHYLLFRILADLYRTTHVYSDCAILCLHEQIRPKLYDLQFNLVLVLYRLLNVQQRRTVLDRQFAGEFLRELHHLDSSGHSHVDW